MNTLGFWVKFKHSYWLMKRKESSGIKRSNLKTLTFQTRRQIQLYRQDTSPVGQKHKLLAKITTQLYCRSSQHHISFHILVPTAQISKIVNQLTKNTGLMNKTQVFSSPVWTILQLALTGVSTVNLQVITLSNQSWIFKCQCHLLCRRNKIKMIFTDSC